MKLSGSRSESKQPWSGRASPTLRLCDAADRDASIPSVLPRPHIHTAHRHWRHDWSRASKCFQAPSTRRAKACASNPTKQSEAIVPTGTASPLKGPTKTDRAKHSSASHTDFNRPERDAGSRTCDRSSRGGISGDGRFLSSGYGETHHESPPSSVLHVLADGAGRLRQVLTLRSPTLHSRRPL